MSFITLNKEIEVEVEVECECGETLSSKSEWDNKIVIKPCTACLSNFAKEGMTGHWYDISQMTRGIAEKQDN